ncbi:CHASE2 domain-containing protein [Cyanobium sp. CH-040]|uniref:CHASE2 domain-containing protein n=1 Tax=Cyanobium sp. CH-040 TaxID=2823708 RepID=UPI0020CCD8E3|nr:adenylate/guanylate cyclase domain-containing protein [Cyanobium sp. CH-040]
MLILKGLSPYLGAVAVVAGLHFSGISQTLNLLLYDLITTVRPATSGLAQPITIIRIEESDIRRLGWPVDDALLCRGLDRLTGAGPLAVGLDLYRDQGVGVDQACLRNRFRSDPRLVSIFNVSSAIEAIPGTPYNRQAYNDLSLDRDGVLRRDLVHVTGQDDATVALPLRLVEVARGDTELRRLLNRGALSGPWLSADSGGYHNETDAGLGIQRMLIFRQPGSFRSYSLSQLLDGEVPEADIRGKIVLIGSTAPSLKDLFLVPMSRFQAGEEKMTLPGVEIHALRLATLLEQQDGRDIPGWLMPGWGNHLLVLAGAGFGIALGEGFRSLRRSVLVTAATTLFLSGGLVVLLMQHVWVSTTTPLVTMVALAGAGWLRRGSASQQHEQQIQRLLGQATSPAVARQLWEQRDQLLREGRFEGRQLPVTILFSDAANFTTVSEALTPAALMAWLNRGLACCVPAVTKRSGMINKFTGDGMLAVFGVPLSSDPSADAQSAIEAALEIRAGLKLLNRELAAEGLPEIRLRIGIHSGEVLAGSMGSSERLEYAVIGDTVNCASRLESFDKERHTGVVRILVSSATRALLNSELDEELAWLPWGPLHLKGRAEPLEVSELQEGQRTGS